MIATAAATAKVRIPRARVDDECGLLISVEGQDITLPRREMLIDDLIPDPRNPRYRYITEQKELTPDEMLALLENEDATNGLVASIERAGGLVEPVIVEMRDDGKGVVREGNRRWASYRILKKKDPKMWRTIPCHILPKGITPKMLAVYIGIIHHQGKLEWDGHSRAGYICEMKIVHKMRVEDIAAALGISRAEVERSVLAYQHSTAIAKRTGEDPPYSKTYEAIKSLGTKAAKVLRSEENREVLYEGVAASENVKEARAVSKVVERPDASRKLMEAIQTADDDGGDAKQVRRRKSAALKSAIAVVKDQDPEATGVFRDMRIAIKHLRRNYAEALSYLQKKRGNKDHVQVFMELAEIVIRLARDSGRTINVPVDAQEI